MNQRIRIVAAATLVTASLSAQISQSASVERIGVPCEKVISLLPDGSGGYLVAQDVPSWNPNVGASIGPFTNDSESAPQNLGFAFPMPGGTTMTQLVATDNGRIMPPAVETFFPFQPAGFWLWSKPFPTIAPFWHSFDPALGGDVFFNALPGVAIFTWQDVVQSTGGKPHTFQAQLRSDGSMVFVYRSTEQYVVAPANNIVIGVSEGGLAPGPASDDFTMLPIFGGSTVYDSLVGSSNETNRLQLGLNALTAPTFGTNFELQLVGIAPGTTAVFILFGFSNPAIDLTPVVGLGLPGCSLYTDATLPATMVGFSDSQSNVQRFPISTDPAALGRDLYLQGAAVTPGATPLGLVLSNGIHGIVGP